MTPWPKRPWLKRCPFHSSGREQPSLPPAAGVESPADQQQPIPSSSAASPALSPGDHAGQAEGPSQAPHPTAAGDEPSGPDGMHGPPWRQGWHPSGPSWHGKRRFLIGRFVRLFVFLMIVIQLGLAGLSFLITRPILVHGPATFLFWLIGGGIVLGGLALAVRLALRWFTGTFEPLAQVMAAADAVTEGDLNVRVPEAVPGEFGRLAAAFNRMVSELQRTDQQRRSLTADVAHELRTPLHVIQGNLEGILDGVYQPDSAQIELLLDETRQLSRLVEDLRTLSLAEAGQLPLRFEPVDVSELLEDVVTSFSAQAEAAGVDLVAENLRPQAEPAQLPLTITGDAGRLDQVLSNLVANALRYTPSGGRVRLIAGPLPGSAAGLRIRVTDTGSGIPAEDLPFIFDRFWRGDRSRQKDGPGYRPGSTGLGLAITRQLVQAHGGKISVESQPGAGTTFTIDLPV